MPPLDTVADATVAQNHNAPSTITLALATASLLWYLTVVTVCTIGCVQIWRYYSSPPDPVSETELKDVPHVTIIRPVKGLEPYLYDCLASTFRQQYPRGKTHVRLCVATRDDAAIPVLERLLRNFPDIDATILVEEEDRILQDGTLRLGPNPKIRNMSRAYRESYRGKGDLIWIADCNVWIGKHTCGRMVARMRGNKFVHQLPLVVDTVGTTPNDETQTLLNGNGLIRTMSGGGESATLTGQERSIWNIGGGRLEEMVMSTEHPKFYIAINTVAVAPCTVGKSSMLNRNYLDSVTDGQGIDYFSYNICEDQLLGDLVWKRDIPEEANGQKLNKHRLCFGDICIQPMSNLSIRDYWKRRVRWLRARKYTVTLATFVEPGTESLACSLYGAYAATTLPFFNYIFSIPPTWSGFFAFWFLSVSIWCFMDWLLYNKLHSADSVHLDEHTPDFARPPKGGRRRPFHEWLLAWLGREILALPLFLWAFWAGATMEWRGKKFWVGMDMRVHEISDDGDTSHANGHLNGKARQD